MAYVLRALSSVGPSSREELHNYITDSKTSFGELEEQLDLETVSICLERWEAKGALIREWKSGVERYSITSRRPIRKADLESDDGGGQKGYEGDGKTTNRY